MNNSMIENIINISLNAGYMLANKQIDIGNNKEFCNDIQKLASKFEEKYNKKNDYFDSIDEFSETEFLKLYKVDTEVNIKNE